MSKNSKNNAPPLKKTEAGNPYELKTDAVNRLVNADKLEIPKEMGKLDPGKRYRSGVLERIPSWIKALFIKFWFNGAVCFFIYWGLGLVIPSMENMILVLAMVLGMVTDILVNNVFRFFAKVEGENDKWMMFPKKRYVNLFLNIIYAFCLLIAVIWLYNVINVSLNTLMGTEEKVYLGVEPIMFGIFYMVIDLVFLGIRNSFSRIIRDAKNKNGME